MDAEKAKPFSSLHCNDRSCSPASVNLGPSDGAQRLECVRFIGAFPWTATPRRQTKAALKRTQSKRFAQFGCGFAASLRYNRAFFNRMVTI